MSVASFIITRGISTSCSRYSRRNFRKFELINKRGTKLFKQNQMIKPHPKIPIDKRGVRATGYEADGRYVEIPEMIPELIVPNLKGFDLKPYVTYKSIRVEQSEFTAENLFDAVYAKKIENDFKKGELDAEGNPLNPSPEEKLTAKEARDLASKTGSDIFTAPPKPLGTIFPDEPR